MKIIEKLEELICEEIHDMKNYAKMALECKDEHPDLAEVFYKLSTEEKRHADMLHAEAVRMIEAHKKEHGEMSAEACAVYKYIHNKNIEDMEKAKRYQDMYRDS